MRKDSFLKSITSSIIILITEYFLLGKFKFENTLFTEANFYMPSGMKKTFRPEANKDVASSCSENNSLGHWPLCAKNQGRVFINQEHGTYWLFIDELSLD